MGNELAADFYERFWEDTEYQLAYAFDSAVRDRFPAIREVWGDLLPPVRVLDFGCGNGILTYWMKRNGFGCEVLGVDVSSAGISFAQREFSCPGLTYQILTHEEFNGEMGQFDVVVSSHTLEHVPDPAKTLAQLRPLAEWFVLEVPLEKCWAQSLFYAVTGGEQRDNPVGHIHFWTREAFLTFLYEQRFLVVREHQYASAPFSPYVPWVKRLCERVLLKILGVRLYGMLMATHFVVLARKVGEDAPQRD